MTDYKLPPLWLPSAFKNDYTKDEMRSYAGLAVAPLLEDLAAHEASNRIKTENLETLRQQLADAQADAASWQQQASDRVNDWDTLRAENAKLREALHSLEVSANTVGYCYDLRPENFASALSELSRQAGLARAALGESE